MKLGILICTFNRPAYLRECLDSLRRADIPKGAEIVIIDDCSNDAATLQLINSSGYTVIRKAKNAGICDSLITGFSYLAQQGCDVMMNLDSDAIVRNDFVQRIAELPDVRKIKTGFHCTTKNANGTDRHKIVEQTDTYNCKASVGGINMCFDAKYYKEIISSILASQSKRLNWDHEICLLMGGAVSVNQSVIQHLGVNSSMGHHEQPDVADTFKGLSLPDVTLVCVDDDYNRALHAITHSSLDIKFADFKIIQPTPKLGSKRAYSEFIMHEVYKYVETSHMLIVQHDGYVKNWKAWDKSWLEWDYIGAPWEWYDTMQVGNGGASLRSKRLMELCKDLPLQTDKDDNGAYAEDHSIARIYRPYLETQGIKFASVEVARKFSIEGWRSDNIYRGQFCFHGKNVIFK